jgi:hypothetical protein
MFHGDDVTKKSKKYAGGRIRLAMIKLLLEPIY